MVPLPCFDRSYCFDGRFFQNYAGHFDVFNHLFLCKGASLIDDEVVWWAGTGEDPLEEYTFPYIACGL